MSSIERGTLRLAVGKELALEAQAVLAAQGAPMNASR